MYSVKMLEHTFTGVASHPFSSGVVPDPSDPDFMLDSSQFIRWMYGKLGRPSWLLKLFVLD